MGIVLGIGKYKYKVGKSGIVPFIDKFPLGKKFVPTELLKNKIIVVVGASSGIGYSIVKSCLRNGANVIAAARSEGELKSIKSTKLEFLRWDVSNIQESSKCIEYIVRKYDRIDSIVLSAGVNKYSDNTGTSPLEKAKEEISFVHQINTIGVCEICRILKKRIVEGTLKSLKIINVISAGALIPVPEAYFTSKHAFYSFTKAFSEENKGLIKVYGIAPGEVDTKMIRQNGFTIFSRFSLNKRMAHPDEIAELVILMSSDSGDILDGNIVIYDGGETILSQFK